MIDAVVDSKSNFTRAKTQAKHWAAWFSPLKDSSMKQTNLNIFYHLGDALSGVGRVSTGMAWFDYWILMEEADQWLLRFLMEITSVPLPDTRAAANKLLDAILAVEKPEHMDIPLSQDEVSNLFRLKGKFEEEFEREHRNIDVFTVMPKGIYNTRLLMENTENKFPESVRKVLPSEMLYDLHQAGRCLAFETPTACAFHIFRATETLIRRYYEVLAGVPWSKSSRNWGEYIAELNKFPDVNNDATMRLDEIRKFERNPSIHPEAVVSLERAPTLFELCSGVIYTMAEEIRKLSPGSMI